MDELVAVVKDTEMKSRILGVSSQINKFDYFYGVLLV